MRQFQLQHRTYNLRNKLLASFIGIIFFGSLFTNSITTSNNLTPIASSGLTLRDFDQDNTFGSTRFHYYWNSSWITQATVQNKAHAAMQDAYSFLVGTWGLNDPTTDGGLGYEPPIEVEIIEKSGYNGFCSWGIWPDGTSADQMFTIGIRPDYLAFDADHEPLKVAGHEFLHACQVRHPGNEPLNWVLEGQARMSQDKFNTWLDHADGTEAGTSYLRESNGYLTGSHIHDLTSLSYPACLFWAYTCEQVGTDKSDPDYGYDVIRDFWNTAANPTSTDGITMFNNMLSFKGYGGTFQSIFEDFSVANYAKDLASATVPSEWKYVDDDETDGSGDYEAVSLRTSGTTITSSNSKSDNYETIERWASLYYEVDIDASARVITVQFNQTTDNTLFYAMLAMTGNNLEYSYTVESKDFARAIVNDNYDKLVVIVVGLENEEANPAEFEYLIEGSTPELSILQPRSYPENYQARAGLYNDPEKFLAIVDISHRQTAPVHGLSTENFEAIVGNQTASVLTAIDVYGKYLLEIQAPNQSANGLYSLTITLVDSDGTTVLASDTNADSVYYGASYVDNALVIDRSGSMATNNKILAAKSAAKLYVNSYLSEDQMAVIAYDNTASLLHKLQKLTSGNRSNAINAIEGISTGGATSIGDGLLKGQNQLYQYGLPNYSKEIILLSDGLENTPPMINDILSHILGNGTIVHVITIGATANSNSELMDNLATTTGGIHLHAFDPASGDIPNDLAEIYRTIVNTIRNLQRFYQARGNINSLTSFQIPVDKDLTELEITVHFNSTASPTISLQDPTGTPIPYTYHEEKSGMGHYFYRISGTIALGDWIVNITPSASLTYFIEGAGKSDITLRLLSPACDAVLPLWGSGKTIGTPQPILISLSDSKPILNARVIVNITHPVKAKHKIWQLPLYDDGGHHDGAPNDGIYGNIFTGTVTNGTYSIMAIATGNSNDYAGFTRIKSGAFHIIKPREQGTEDSDYDGLPDRWEEWYGLDPKDNVGEQGPTGDPDKDTIVNIDEFYHATDPLNSDTDYGGEGDGSEIANGRNPLDPTDDTLGRLATIRVYPNNGFIRFFLPNGSGYAKLYIFRSSSPTFGYNTIYNSIYPTTDIWEDATVVNYNIYYYRFLAETADGRRTGMSRDYQSIPKLKNIAPEGNMVLNDGNKTTEKVWVNVKIYHIENDLTNESSFVPTQMRLAESIEELYSKSWTTFKSNTIWLFPNGSTGLKVIYAQLRDNQTIPEVSNIFSAGIRIIGIGIIGPETQVTIGLILINLFVLTVIFYKKKRIPQKIQP
ncbi:MAG: vWA domain-containing protein [Candidatus Helarchaeota archaeon]